MNQILKVLRTSSEVLELANYLSDKDIVSFDTETKDLGYDATIIGYSICAESDVGYYVVTNEWDKEKQKLVSLDSLDPTPELMRQLATKSLIMHNAAFDCARVMYNYGVELMPSVVADTMILAHILDENRRCGLKELGVAYYGDSAKKEQTEMKESVEANGGKLTKKCFELYKADSELIGKYACKDAILTFNLFYEFAPQLEEEGLTDFFFKDESMPLLRGPTYSLNTSGLKVDIEKLATLKRNLEIDICDSEAYIHHEIQNYIKDQYPGTNKKNTFNINSGRQLAWLLFERLSEPFPKLGEVGQELCKAFNIKYPRTKDEREEFIKKVTDNFGVVWRDKGVVWDKYTRTYKGQAKVGEWWTYCSTDKVVLKMFSGKYGWVDRILKMNADKKLLSTYVEGIQSRMRYGVIYPSFLQHGTTGGRYSSRDPNFQNLPRDDKRVKSCIVSRPGKVFVGADYAQLEPRVFASISGDKTLQDCFKSGQDFYSVVGMPIFGKTDCSPFKDDIDSFAKKYPKLRDAAKVIALATPYGRTARQQASAMGIKIEEAERLIREYFSAYPKVEEMMLTSHEMVKKNGYVKSIFGRPRRIPDATLINHHFGDTPHSQLPYEARQLLNLAMNHRVQSTAASIMNRASIAFYNKTRGLKSCNIVLQVHDELVAECLESDADLVVQYLKDAMENTVTLPGVKLQADPKIGRNLADLK